MIMMIHQSFSQVALGLAPILLLCTGRVLAQSVPEAVPHVVVVQFEAGISLPGKTSTTGLQVFDRRAAAYGLHTIERMYPFLHHVNPTPKTRRNLLALRRTYYVRYSTDATPERVSRDLALAPSIVYAEPVPVNRIREPVSWEHVDPNDPRFNDQPQLGLMRLPEAWDVVKASDGTPKVVIATVDGGGEWRHEDLRANVWTNEDEIPGNGIDDDNNGFIDDLHGVNIANGDTTNNDPTGLLETPGNARHGTAVAGWASAVINNNVGVAGAAWNAEIMHINAGCDSVDNYICYGYEGILYAATNGADIINVSWTTFVSDDQGARHLDQALDLATDMGAQVVAAASSGTPKTVTSSPILYTFKATDGLVFSIEVLGPVTSEQEGLPEPFMVHGNYPNPFRESTRLVVDLPWSATVNVEVFDVMGRRVLSPPPVNLTAGWNRSIRLEGAALPSGLYLYRIRANSPVGIYRKTGRFMRVR